MAAGMESASLLATLVVTAFLYRRGRVLLLRRSGRVGSYQARWAGVSGYLERPPLAQARVELGEEVAVSSDQAALRGLGIPILMDDPGVVHPWLVFPFLFRLRENAVIQTDWETQQTAWVRPGELANYHAVPGLADAFFRVWPPWGGPQFWQEMEAIATDTARGATALADAALRSVSRVRGRSRRRAIRALAALHPSMGVFPHVAARLLAGGTTPAKLRHEVARAGEASSQQAGVALRTCRRVLTHSASSACRRALLDWWQEGREIVVTESRPKREGIGLARDFASQGLRVRVISDAEMGLFVPKCDAVLVGADAIGAGEEIVNKVGTRLAVMAAKEAGVAAYAVTQTHKICPPAWPLGLTPQNPADLARVADARVANIAFDSTPLSWFSAVFTEKGRLTKQSLQRVRRGLRVNW